MIYRLCFALLLCTIRWSDPTTNFLEDKAHAPGESPATNRFSDVLCNDMGYFFTFLYFFKMHNTKNEKEALATHCRELARFEESADHFRTITLLTSLVTTSQLHNEKLDPEDWLEIDALTRILVSFAQLKNSRS